MKRLSVLLGLLVLAGCDKSAEQAGEPPATEAVAVAVAEETLPNRLAAILDAQPEEFRARYQYRHPQETLAFIGIEPGMTVVEGLPGSGWYTKVLLPYLGSEGRLIGANYEIDVWPLFPFGTEEFVDAMRTWTTDFPAGTAEWGVEDGAEVDAFIFGSMPAEFAGTADVVFFPRVLHNLARFQNEGVDNFLDRALADAYAVLKPGGTFGVVQHHARDEMSDEFADGSHGYLKKAWLIEQIENAGFEFVAESDINANEKDQPSEDDIVWRLPPSLATSGEDPELRAEYEAIGESNRMTLKFRKPG